MRSMVEDSASEGRSAHWPRCSECFAHLKNRSTDKEVHDGWYCPKCNVAREPKFFLDPQLKSTPSREGNA